MVVGGGLHSLSSDIVPRLAGAIRFGIIPKFSRFTYFSTSAVFPHVSTSAIEEEIRTNDK